jgi:hypothetical protein
MRVDAQQVMQEDYFTHAYTLFVPNNQARKWATYILKKLNINRRYISRRQGFYETGERGYIARYVGTINNDQHRALVGYLPYAPVGVDFECPTCPTYN